MAIKGGLLDCEGQSENEENFNRIQERYGYEEKWTEHNLSDWGGIAEHGNKTSNCYTISGSSGLILLPSEQFNPNTFPSVPCIVHVSDGLNDNVFYTEKQANGVVPLGGEYKWLYMNEGANRVTLVMDSYQSAFTARYNTYTITVYTIEDKSTVYPMDSKYLPAAEAVADAAGDTVTGEEFNALLASLRNAGYLSK